MPTPVSALIHAATLVCAGVYVMVRLSVFYDDLILIVGSLTALMAGIFGFFQSDLKRVIAFSTCSQLGYCSATTRSNQVNMPKFYYSSILRCDPTSLSASSVGGGSHYSTESSSTDGTVCKDLIPTQFVEYFTDLSTKGRSFIKRKYKGTAVIYLWHSQSSGRTYVGRTVNLQKRLGNYADISYLNRNKNKMPICGAINLYGINTFHLYILEVVTIETIAYLPFREGQN